MSSPAPVEERSDFAELVTAINTAIAEFDDIVWDMSQKARPKARGWLHAASAVAAPAAAGWLIAHSDPGPRRAGAAVFGAGMCAMFAASGTYHRLSRDRRMWEKLRRLDHSMIYVMIAGTWTPIAIATLPPATAGAVLAAVWGSTAVAVRTKVRRLSASDTGGSWFYAVLGASGVAMLIPMAKAPATGVVPLFAAGGAAYALGGAMFAAQRPNPWPTVVGFHELFHALVVAGVVCHFSAIGRLVTTAP